MLILIAGLIVIAYALYVPWTLKNAEQSADNPDGRERLKRFRESPSRRTLTSFLRLIGIGLTVWGIALVLS